MTELSTSEIFERAKSVVGARTDAELGKHLQKSANQVSVWRQRNTIPLEQLVDFAKTHRVPLEWLLTGEGRRARDEVVDLDLFLEICIALHLGRNDWRGVALSARDALRLAFGPDGLAVHLAADEIDMASVAHTIEGAYGESFLALAAADVYNRIAESDRREIDRCIFLSASTVELNSAESPLPDDARRHLRGRMIAIVERASKRLSELRTLRESDAETGKKGKRPSTK